jgi:type IV pilus assembly protein PilM
MSSVLVERVRSTFAPPRYLAFPLSGVDLSTSGVKAVRLAESLHGLILAKYAEEKLSPGAFVDGEIADAAVVAEKVAAAAKAADIFAANVALPESRSFIFETTVPESVPDGWRVGVEQHLDELVPLPPTETMFDIVKIGNDEQHNTHLVGVGFAHRIIDDTLSMFDKAHIEVRALEEESFSMTRALLPLGDESTVLIIDIGKTTTKIAIATKRIPRFSTKIDIGGHAFTLAVQKYFGVTEEEARKVKSERGITPDQGNEEYLAAMLSTASAIRDEISHCLDYWQEKASLEHIHEPVSHAIISGGNASIKGLPEYFEMAFKVPVVLGNVFTNFAPHDVWIPSLNYTESLSYTTAIGLALYDHIK